MRRSVAALATLLTLALVLAGPAAPSSPPVPPADEATAYQLDATHDGSIQNAGLTAPLTQAWSIPMPNASYALIVDGMVFVTSSTSNGNDTVYALNQATGATIWSHPLGGTYSWTGLAYDRGRVFTLNGLGMLTAFDATTGATAWSTKLGQYQFTSPPTAVNGMLYTVGAGSGGTVYAVDESNGQTVWAQGVGWGSSSSPAVTAAGVYISFGSQSTLAFDPHVGTLLWFSQSTGSGGVGTTPVVASGHVLARDPSGNHAFDPATGAVQGTFPDAGSANEPYSIPAVANTVAYIVTGQPSSTTLNAIASSGLGGTNWTFTGDGKLDTAPVVAGGIVYVGSANGNLYALDATTGATTWTTNVGASQAVTRLTAANGTLIASAGSNLVAYTTSGASASTPANQAAPSISGATDLNETEAADVGVWSGLPTAYTYQWQRCDAAGANCADITGATGLSYVTSSDDYDKTLRVAVAATNGAGTSSPVESAPTAVLGLATAPPVLSAPPVLLGTAAVGQTLSTTNGTWTNSPTSFTYQWQRCDFAASNCVDIQGATSAHYTPVAADIGFSVRSKVLASNNIGPAPGGYAPSPTSDVIRAGKRPPDDQATSFQEDATHDGTIGPAGLTAPLTQAWSTSLPDTPSSSLIADGRVFVIANSTVYALNQASGATLWSHPIGANGALAYDRGRVFVSAGTFYSGLLTAYDAATGAIAWTEQPPGSLSWGAPAARNGVIYLGGNVPGATMYGIRESDGTVLWSQPVTEFTGYGVPAPAVTAQGVYVDGIYDFDPQLGTVLWHRTNVPSGTTGPPVVGSGYVFAGNALLSPATGAVQGSFKGGAGGYAFSSPAIANGVTYTITGSPPSTTLTAVDGAGLGNTKWSFAGDGAIDTAPIVIDGSVFVGSSAGNLYALDAKTGATTWTTAVGAQPVTSLAAANGTLILSAGHNVIAYRNAGPITAAPANESPPTVNGSSDLNEVHAADVGVWSGLPGAYAYQWELCDSNGANCADIGGATGPTYVPGAGAYGQTLRVRVTATNGVGSSSAVESAATDVLGLATAAPEFLTSPVVSGTATVGQQLSTTNGTWTNSATSYAYQWQRCDTTGASCVDIQGATSSQYTLGTDDLGSEIRSEVLASNSIGQDPTGYAPSATTSLVVQTGAPTIAAPPADEASAYQLDATHDGYVANAGLSGSLTQAWSIAFQGGFLGYPVIAQGMVFVTALNGSGVDTVFALNEATGSVVWSQPTGGYPNSAVGLAYDRGRIFYVDEVSGLTAFDAQTGAVVWNVQIPYQSFQSPPTAANGIVYTSSGDNVFAIPESPASAGTAGSLPAGTTVDVIPVPAGTTASISNGDSIVVSVGTAQMIFKAIADVAIGETSIPVASKNVGSVDLSGGDISDSAKALWTQPILGGMNSAPAVTPQGVYVAYDGPQVYDFDPQLGTVLWHRSACSTCVGGGGSAPVVADGHVFASDSSGNLIYSAATGAVQGSFSGAPALANGEAYVLGGSWLNAIAADGFGGFDWSDNIGSGSFSAAPIVAGNVIFEASASPSGNMYAFDRATGATLWSTAGAGPRYLAASNGILVAAATPDTSHSVLTAYRSAGTITTPPSNQAVPSVEGPADLSGLEAADVGVWSGLPSAYSYQWELCDGTGANCTDIAGATGASYLPSPDEVGVGDTLRVRIVAMNGVGSSAPVESIPSATDPLMVVNQQGSRGQGRVVSGSADVGGKISTTNGIWTNDPTNYTYKWQRCNALGRNCTDIPGATSPHYTPVAADLGYALRSEVRARNGVGTAALYVPSDLTRPVGAPAKPALLSAPVVKGTAAVGSQLSTTTGVWSHAPTSFTYRWQRCNASGSKCVNIASATGATYTVVSADLGHTIRSGVLASNALGSDASGYASSAPTAVVGGKPGVIALPRISGTAKVGNSLSVSTGTWKNAPTSYAYQWLRCTSSGTSCKKIAGATSSSYKLAAADAGHKLKATVTAANAAGSATATSKPSGTVKK